MEGGSYWLDKVQTSIWRDVKTLAIEEAYTTKYSIHPGADTMLCGFKVTILWAVTRENELSGSNLVQETTNEILIIQERLVAAKLLKELVWKTFELMLVGYEWLKVSLWRVKVRWDSKRGPELTWERKDQMRSKCPQLFVDSANASSKPGDGVTSIKRWCRDLQSDGVKDFVTTSERSRLKEDLELSTWRRLQNGCSFHGLRSNQQLKDFLKLVDSLDLDVANGERTRLRLFQFSLHDQASNWMERLPAGSIFIWEDLTTRFLAQFFPPGRTAQLRNDILMFQQHQGESISKACTHFKDLH
ncbi:zinc finger, CCHC-type containing protein [Tanacetum coccineum]